MSTVSGCTVPYSYLTICWWLGKMDAISRDHVTYACHQAHIDFYQQHLHTSHCYATRIPCQPQGLRICKLDHVTSTLSELKEEPCMLQRSFGHMLLVHEHIPYLVPVAHLAGCVPANDPGVSFHHTMSAWVFAKMFSINWGLHIISGDGSGCYARPISPL